jgi:hypothetical protein
MSLKVTRGLLKANMLIPLILQLFLFKMAITGWSADSSSFVKPIQTDRKATARQSAVRPARKIWKPANFKGLIPGRARRAAMLRILGQPKRTERLKREIWYHYDSPLGAVQGDAVVMVDSRSQVIDGIYLSPDNLYKADAIRLFGPGYIITRYDFDNCLGDGESAPMYESSKGNLTYIEYRSKGIAISFDYNDEVIEIGYVKGAIGAKFSKCARRHRRKRPVARLRRIGRR